MAFTCGRDDCPHHVYDRGQRAHAPHCDQRVLHAPGECLFCDHYTDWQQHRQVAGIAFTGQDPGLDRVACPSDARRGRGGAHVWGGNVPQRA
jgi:hypothetical protein